MDRRGPGADARAVGAAQANNKNIDDQPPADMAFEQRGGRLHRAMDLLRNAHNEVAREEDDPAARRFTNRALHQIDAAAAATDAAMHAWNF